jgi:hypothetical protein
MASGELDVSVDFTSRDEPAVSYQAGGEVVISELVPIRAGFHHDRARREDFVGFGVGVRGEAAELSYGFRTPVTDGELHVWDGGAWHALELRFML